MLEYVVCYRPGKTKVELYERGVDVADEYLQTTVKNQLQNKELAWTIALMQWPGREVKRWVAEVVPGEVGHRQGSFVSDSAASTFKHAQ